VPGEGTYLVFGPSVVRGNHVLGEIDAHALRGVRAKSLDGSRVSVFEIDTREKGRVRPSSHIPWRL